MTDWAGAPLALPTGGEAHNADLGRARAQYAAAAAVPPPAVPAKGVAIKRNKTFDRPAKTFAAAFGLGDAAAPVPPGAAFIPARTIGGN